MIGATSRVKLGVPPDMATAAKGIATAGISASPSAIQVRRLRMLGVICTPKVAQDATDLADRASAAQRLA